MSEPRIRASTGDSCMSTWGKKMSGKAGRSRRSAQRGRRLHGGRSAVYVGRMFKPTLAALSICAFASSLAAQLPIPSSNAKVRAALDIIKADNAWTVQQQVELTQIPAPPFKESRRGAEFKKRLEALGLHDIRVDTAGNVIAMRKGTGNGPTVMIAGHLDTVFPEGTDV